MSTRRPARPTRRSSRGTSIRPTNRRPIPSRPSRDHARDQAERDVLRRDLLRRDQEADQDDHRRQQVAGAPEDGREDVRLSRAGPRVLAEREALRVRGAVQEEPVREEQIREASASCAIRGACPDDRNRVPTREDEPDP
jgi:hypothetical protein